MNKESGQARLRLLGVFAHPDDETFCIGGTLAKYVAGGAEAMVVSFTRGEAGQIRDAGVATRRTLGETRAQELRHACQKLGVQHVLSLDYGDGKLQDVPQSTLVEHVVEIIRDFRPDVVFTFDDSGAYGHPDHIAISRATTTACRLAGNPAHFPEQVAAGLTAYSPTRLYHSYFPRNSRLMLDLIVRWLQSLDTRFRGTDDFLHGLMLFADESTMLGYASDHLKVAWYPKGFYIIEQGEPPTCLYLILSGHVDIFREETDGSMRYLETHGPGVFVGEASFASGEPRNAHVIAADNVTCLALSPAAPTAFAGRGEEARFTMMENNGSFLSEEWATTCIDVTAFVQQKMEAMAQHRSQYPVTPDMFPREMLEEMLGREYFVQIHPRVEMRTELLPSSFVPIARNG